MHGAHALGSARRRTACPPRSARALRRQAGAARADALLPAPGRSSPGVAAGHGAAPAAPFDTLTGHRSAAFRRLRRVGARAGATTRRRSRAAGRLAVAAAGRRSAGHARPRTGRLLAGRGPRGLDRHRLLLEVLQLLGPGPLLTQPALEAAAVRVRRGAVWGADGPGLRAPALRLDPPSPPRADGRLQPGPPVERPVPTDALSALAGRGPCRVSIAALRRATLTAHAHSSRRRPPPGRLAPPAGAPGVAVRTCRRRRSRSATPPVRRRRSGRRLELAVMATPGWSRRTSSAVSVADSSPPQLLLTA